MGGNEQPRWPTTLGAWIVLVGGCSNGTLPGESSIDTATASSSGSTSDAPSGPTSASTEQTGLATTTSPSSTTDSNTTHAEGSSEADDGSSSTGDAPRPATLFEATDFLAPYETVVAAWGPGNGWADLDRDGWLDLVTAGGEGPSHVYLNLGDGTLDEWAADDLLESFDRTIGVSIADFDNDGWSDIYLLRNGANVLLRNLDGTGLEDVTVSAGVGDPHNGTSASWADYDGDGWLDLYVANAENEPDVLYHADGDGTFSDVSTLVQPPEDYQAFVGVWLDYDDDGDLDLYVSNDKQVGNRLWRNDGPGCAGWCFVDAAPIEGAALAECSMGVAVGDYDNDLDLDIVFTDEDDIDLVQNLRAQGTEGFVHASAEAGLGEMGVGWGVFLFDYDNDRWPDLYLAEGYIPKRWTNLLYHNNGDGTFEDVTGISGCADSGYGFGVTYADVDHDGALDMMVSNRHEGHRLYRNQALWPEHHWLAIDLEGGGSINRDAIGARVWVTTDGGHTMMQEVKAGSSVSSVNPTRLHFGLGLEHLQTISIRWPNGEIEEPAVPEEDTLWEHAHPG
ncbi:MAG: CRTAC1 family protein [Myxococcota bacterium]